MPDLNIIPGQSTGSLHATLRVQYFLYFGVMGMILPFFNLYCYQLGFSGFQIGLLSSAKSVTIIIFTLMWGALADRFQNRKAIYIVCNLASTCVWALYLLTAEYNLMLLITVCYGIFYAPLVAFLEAITMDVLKGNKQNYGKIRVWGSIAFIAVVVLLGKVIELYSVRIILALVLAGSLLQCLVAFRLPAMPARPAGQRLSLKLKSIVNLRLIIFLACTFLMLVSHGAYYGFFSIHLTRLGFSGTFVGIAWAVAVGAEIIIMFNSDRIFTRFSLEKVLVFSFLVAAGRWLLLFAAGSPEAILISQLLHAITYGAFHMASILYIDQLMPEDAKTSGQALNNAFTYGLGLMVGFMISGFLYERLDTAFLFLISSAIALLAGMILGTTRLVSRPNR